VSDDAGEGAKAGPEDVPSRVAHFRILGKLGEGGMGVVYRAEDEKLRRTVALKLLPDASRSEERRQRFLREARSAAAITHPNVAVIHAVDEADGRVYIAMELVEGESLRAKLHGGPLDLATAREVLLQMARGLAAAHERGIVHRDLKPENVMITAAGVVKLLDFGLAKAAGPRSGSRPGATETALAKTETLVTSDEGRVMGTPEYMSPEQALGEPLDVRSDVFSFGIVAYEMLTGARPFAGASTGAVLVAIARDTPPPLRERAPQVDEAMSAIVTRCLAKAPAERFASAGEIVTALSAGASPRAVTAAADPARAPSARATSEDASSARTRRAALALTLVALLVLLGAVGLVSSRRASGPATGATITAPAASSAPGRGIGLLDGPPPKTNNPEAAREYRLGLQAIHDASFASGRAHLDRAVALDPDLAEAHLMLTWGWPPWTIEVLRKHAAAAAAMRNQLDERGQAILDELQRMLLMDNVFTEETFSRGKVFLERFPRDAVYTAMMGFAGLILGHVPEGLQLLDRAEALDPTMAIPSWARGMFLSLTGDADGAASACDRCLEISPSAVDCIDMRAQLDLGRGQCERLEQDARRMLAIDGSSAHAYGWLTAALVARGAPLESIEEAMGRAEEPAPAASAQPQSSATGDDVDRLTTLSWLTGDFTGALAALPEIDRWATSSRMDVQAGDAINAEVQVLRETGQNDRAAAVAERFVRRYPALAHDAVCAALTVPCREARDVALLALHRAGRISDADFRAKRDAWAREAVAQSAPAVANRVWFYFYALTALTPAEAREALDTLPRFSPMPSTAGVIPEERMMGQVLLLAGRVDEAIVHLRGALTPCASTDALASRVIAAELLGEALESKGDAAGACDAYREVLARWGHAKPRSVTADAARAHATKLGCAVDAGATGR
jgi:serine/threonine-protein kinase